MLASKQADIYFILFQRLKELKHASEIHTHDE